MMLVTLLLLFLNSNTHAADGYIIKSYFNENTVHTKFPTDFYTFKFKNKEENDIEIKSKISYNGKDYDSKIKFRINIYFGNKFSQSDAQIKFKKYLQDKYVIPIFNQIKNGFDKNIADTFEHNIWPIIYLCDEGEYNFFYNVKNNNYIYNRGYYFNIIEKDILLEELAPIKNRYFSNVKKQTDSTTVNQFYKDYLDTTSTKDIPQNELIITIFDGEILHEQLTNERKYIPYFDSFSDLQKYIGNDIELYYYDKNTNTDIQMKEQKDYDDCKSKKQEFKIEYIDTKNIKEDKDDILKEYLLERYRSDIRAKKIDKDKNKQTQKKTDTKNKPTPNKTNPTQNKINNSNSNSQLKTNKCCCNCCKNSCKNRYR